MKALLTLGACAALLSVSTVARAQTRTCFILTYNGHYLTAVGGGGRIDDVIHSDATKGSTWETFKIVESSSVPGTYGIKTLTGNYLTVVDGGGRIEDVIHSDATKFRDWEEFRLVSLGNGYTALKTYRGNYLTAVSGGGRTTDVIHSDATKASTWESFKLNCRN